MSFLYVTGQGKKRNNTPTTPASASTSYASTEMVEVDVAESTDEDEIPDTGEQAMLDARGYVVPGEHINLW